MRYLRTMTINCKPICCKCEEEILERIQEVLCNFCIDDIKEKYDKKEE